MSRNTFANLSLAALTAMLGGAAGYWLASQDEHGAEHLDKTVVSQAQVLYWYDPMVPQHRFDKPGKSPFMDMDLVPRYAGESGDAAAISIDAGITQNLGVRLASVTRGQLASQIEAVGVLEYNARDVAVVQARAGGFVERVYHHAPGDLLDKGAPLADLLIPEWSAAQEEYLALRRIGEPALLDAARQRLRLAGMPAATISQLERSGKVSASITIVTPISGVLQELDVREGMSLAAGAPLARINGLDSVWLEVAVPEAQSTGIGVGQRATARLPAMPGERIEGTITAVLPEANAASRTLRVRVQLPNPQGLLRPGLTAQATLNGADNTSALLIPSEAVIRTGRRSLVMLVTNLRDEDSDDLLAAVRMLQQRHHVVVASLREEALDAVLEEDVHDLRGALRASAAARYMAQRTAVHDALRSHRVGVLDVTCEQLPGALVERYLAVKRDGVL